MKKISLIVFMLFILASDSFTQNKPIPKLTGWWINIQYDYFKNHIQSEEILFHISPWFIYIDSFGKCTIESLYEQKAEIGYPISQKKWGEELEYYYKNVWLYSVKDNDSLIVYRISSMPPGAGIIFKKYTRDIPN